MHRRRWPTPSPRPPLASSEYGPHLLRGGGGPSVRHEPAPDAAGSTGGGALAGERRWTAAHPRLADAGLAALLVLAVLPTLGIRNPEFPGSPDGWSLVLFALAAAALVLRREQPLVVWAFATSAGVAGVLLSDGSISLAAATCLALYTVGSRLPLRSGVLATVVSGAAYTLAAVLAEGDGLDDRDVPGHQTFAWGPPPRRSDPRCGIPARPWPPQRPRAL